MRERLPGDIERIAHVLAVGEEHQRRLNIGLVMSAVPVCWPLVKNTNGGRTQICGSKAKEPFYQASTNY